MLEQLPGHPYTFALLVLSGSCILGLVIAAVSWWRDEVKWLRERVASLEADLQASTNPRAYALRVQQPLPSEKDRTMMAKIQDDLRRIEGGGPVAQRRRTRIPVEKTERHEAIEKGFQGDAA
jgi:hypothetical protein